MDSKKFAKQTLINYKKELESQGKIERKISKQTRRPIYYMPENWKQELKILIKREVKENIDKLTPEEFIELKKEFYDTFVR